MGPDSRPDAARPESGEPKPPERPVGSAHPRDPNHPPGGDAPTGSATGGEHPTGPDQAARNLENESPV